jgi:hypothetical protein
MNPNRKTELLVGLFLLVGLLMVGAIILQFGRVAKTSRTPTPSLKVSFPNAPGIKQWLARQSRRLPYGQSAQTPPCSTGLLRRHPDLEALQ